LIYWPRLPRAAEFMLASCGHIHDGKLHNVIVQIIIGLHRGLEHDDGTKPGVGEELKAENICLHISCTLPLIPVSFRGSFGVSSHVFSVSRRWDPVNIQRPWVSPDDGVKYLRRRKQASRREGCRGLEAKPGFWSSRISDRVRFMLERMGQMPRMSGRSITKKRFGSMTHRAIWSGQNQKSAVWGLVPLYSVLVPQ
jgi:hypothetical protein